MGGKFFRGLALAGLLALVFLTSCQAWWVGGEVVALEAFAE
jgi:hypothetical protein